MARTKFTFSNASPVSTGTGRRTLLRGVAPANQKIVITRVFVSCRGTSPTAMPIAIKVLTGTTGEIGSGAGASNLPPQKVDQSDSTAIQTTAADGHTTPAALSGAKLILHGGSHVQSSFQWRGERIIKAGEVFTLETDAPSAVDVSFEVEGEE